MQAGQGPTRSSSFGDRLQINEATAGGSCAKWSRNLNLSTPMYTLHYGEGLLASRTPPPFHRAYHPEHSWPRSSTVVRCLRVTLLLMCVWLCYADPPWRPPVLSPRPSGRGAVRSTHVHFAQTDQHLSANADWVMPFLIAYLQPAACSRARTLLAISIDGVQGRAYSDSLHQSSVWFLLPAAALVAPTLQAADKNQGHIPTLVSRWRILGMQSCAFKTDGKNRREFDQIAPQPAACTEDGGVCGPLSGEVEQLVTKRAGNGSAGLFSRAAEEWRRSHAAQVSLFRTEARYGPEFDDRGLSEQKSSSSPRAVDEEDYELEFASQSVCPTPADGVGAAKRKLSSAILPQNDQIEESAPKVRFVNVTQGQSHAELTTVPSPTYRARRLATDIDEIEVGHTHPEGTNASQSETGGARRYGETRAQLPQQRSTVASLQSAEQDSLLGFRGLLSRPSPSQRLQRRSQQAAESLPSEEDSDTPKLGGSAEAPLQPAHQQLFKKGSSAKFLPEWGTHAGEEHVPVAEGGTRLHHGSDESGGEERVSGKLGERWSRPGGTGNFGSSPTLTVVEPRKDSTIPPGDDPKANNEQVGTKKGRDFGSPSVSSAKRFYRTEEVPKTYGDSASSHVLNRERTGDTGGSPSVQYLEGFYAQREKSTPGAAENGTCRREAPAEAEMFDKVAPMDAESVARVEAILSQQVRSLERQATTLEEQLKGIHADMEFYRAGIEGVDPEQNADIFEQLVHGGQGSAQQMLLEKLQAASASLDNRVKNYVRTNTTFYAHQLNDIVQVRLAPLRQGVLDLSMNLIDAASSTIDITRKLNEAARHVNATVTREAAQMQKLRMRKELAFTEILEEEEVRMQAHLVALKQKEQRRVNKSSVEEQILLAAVEGAVDDLKKRGFAVLDFSAVYPESEARKVLDLTLHYTDLRTRPHGWEVLPIVVVPSSGFVGHVGIPQTASEWLTGVLAATYGDPPGNSADRTTAVQTEGNGADAVDGGQRARNTEYSPFLQGDNPATTQQDRSRQAFEKIPEGHIITVDSADLDHVAAKDGDKRSAPQKQNTLGPTYKKGSRTRSVLLPAALEWGIHRRSSSSGDSLLGSVRARTSDPSTTTTARRHLTEEQHPAETVVEIPVVGVSSVARPNGAAKMFDGETQQDFAFPQGQYQGAAGLQRQGSEATAQKDLSEARSLEMQLPAAEGTGSDTSNDCNEHGRCGDSSLQIGQRKPRRLSLLEDAWRGRCTRAFERHIHRSLPRNRNTRSQPQLRNSPSVEAQFFSSPQLILGESHPDEDQAEAGRKWQAVVLGKTRAVVASYWGKTGHLPGQATESRWARSILPPTYTLQHLVRDHFKNFPSEGIHLRRGDEGAHTPKHESTHYDDAGAAIQGSIDAYYSDNSTGASRAASQSGTAHDKGTGNVEQAPVLGNRIGYYVLRAEKILLEGFYVAPGGEVKPVLLRYPPLKDLGPLVHSHEYGVQLLRQFATSLHTRPERQKRCSAGVAAKSSARPFEGGKHIGNDNAAGQAASGVKQATECAGPTDSSVGARHNRLVKAEEGGKTEGAPHCAPANYNPFLRCLTSRPPPGVFRQRPTDATGSRSTEGEATLSQHYKGSRETEQDISSSEVPGGNAGILRKGAHHLQEPAGLRKPGESQTASEKGLTPHAGSKGRKFEETYTHQEGTGRRLSTPDAGVPDKYSKTHHRAPLQGEAVRTHKISRALRKHGRDPPGGSPEGQSPGSNSERTAPLSSTHTNALTSRGEGTLSDAEMEDAKLRLIRKVLIIHLGPRGDGLSLAYPDAVEGKELQRQRLVRRSLTELLASSDTTNISLEDCGSCTVSLDDNSIVEPQLTKPQHTVSPTSPAVPEEHAGSPTQKLKVSMRDVRTGNTQGDADPRRASNDPQSPRRFGQLDAVGAQNVKAVTLAKTLRSAKMESAVRRQLLALEQELRLASPTRWAANGALAEKHLGNHQVEKCPKKFGSHSYSVPPRSVLEHALYLLAHPVAGHAAIAAFHYGKTSEASLLERVRKAHKPLEVTASDIALHAASFWGRATGASMETFWIAHVHVGAPGKPVGSTIELLDGRLTAVPVSLMPLSDSAEKQIFFPSEVQAWGWRYAEPFKPDEGPFLKGRVASYGASATECKPVETLVSSTAATLQTRVIPQTFVSGLRGRSIIVAISGTDTPFKGEQLLSEADLEAQWLAETSRHTKQ